MKKIIIIFTAILMSLVGYSQNTKLSIKKIQKEVKISDKNNFNNVVDYITETTDDSIHGKVVSFYTLYSKDSVIDKVMIEHTANGVKTLTKEEIYIKNNLVIYYKGYDYATANKAEVYFKDYFSMVIKVNDKYCSPEIEVYLLFQNHISSYISYLKSRYK